MRAGFLAGEAGGQEQPAEHAEQAQLAWIAEFLEGLGPNPDGRFIMGWTNPSSNLQSVMENEMVQASAEYEEAHGEPFESIEDQSSHADVGYLADLIEEHFRAHGATDAQIRAMYPEDTTETETTESDGTATPDNPAIAAQEAENERIAEQAFQERAFQEREQALAGTPISI